MDEEMVERIRGALADRGDVEEKRMFGGLTFMVRGHMCCGVSRTEVMFRLGPDAAEAALVQPGVRPMDITGRPLKGMVFVDPEAIADEGSLGRWVDRAVDFVETLPSRS